MRLQVAEDLASLRDALKATRLASRDYDLRPMTLADVDGPYRQWLQDDEVIRYLHVALADRRVEALRAYVRSVSADPTRFMFLVVERWRDRAVGTAGLTLLPLHNQAGYGFLIGERDSWGTDAALQAQVALLDFAFGPLKIRKIQAGVYARNTTGMFNVRRLGFLKEGVLREDALLPPDGAQTCDVVRFGMLAREWSAASGKFDHLRRTGP